MSGINVHKVILGTQKVVLLRDIRIRDQEIAAKAVGSRAGDNSLAMATMMQKELLKLLIVEIDGKKIAPNLLEDLDALFTFQEYMQLAKVVAKLMGDEGELGNFKVELVASGGT